MLVKVKFFLVRFGLHVSQFGNVIDLYVTLNLVFLASASPVVAVCNDHSDLRTYRFKRS